MTRQAGLICSTQVPAVQIFPGPQATQAEPLLPQAVAVVAPAATQVLPLQQPVQLVALHSVPPVQMPPVQAEPLVQAAQAAPLSPQLVMVCEVGSVQVLFEQQPAQLKKSHALPVVHTPLRQTLLPWQVVQAAPAVPHCAADWLAQGTQRVPEQQPFGHEDGVQAAVPMHTPLVQLEVGLHWPHAAPPVPQAERFCCAQGRQRGPMQQPLAQELESQLVDGVQTPPTQTSVPWQVVQAAAPMPHAAALC